MENLLPRLQMRNGDCVMFPMLEALDDGTDGELQLGSISGHCLSSPFLVNCSLWISWSSFNCIMPMDMSCAFVSFQRNTGRDAESQGGSHTSLALTARMRDVAERKSCVVYRRWNKFHMFLTQAVFVYTVRAFPVPIFNFHTKYGLF